MRRRLKWVQDWMEGELALDDGREAPVGQGSLDRITVLNIEDVHVQTGQCSLLHPA